MLVYPNSNIAELQRIDHPVFLEVENQFWQWLQSSNPAMEYEEKYFGDESIYTKKGAIRGAIESIVDEANEENKPVNVGTFDFDAVFA